MDFELIERGERTDRDWGRETGRGGGFRVS